MMMGCGAYPVNSDLLTSIETEVRQNVKRMRHHPSIVLWCGNNEDYMFAEIHKLTYNPEDTDPASWLKTNWPARYYYEKMFPEICAKYSPRIPYLPSSPFSPPAHDLPHRLANDTETGDTHAWRVWMADQPRLPYQQYGSISGRFVSEFGMKSYPCLRTLEAHITKPADRHPQSRILDAWHMAPEDQRTLALYLNENFRHGIDLPSYVYATQLLQAEAMDFAVRAFRRGWRGLGHEECAGSLIWQLNGKSLLTVPSALPHIYSPSSIRIHS
jgi:beta-mannosidase